MIPVISSMFSKIHRHHIRPSVFMILLPLMLAAASCSAPSRSVQQTPAEKNIRNFMMPPSGTAAGAVRSTVPEPGRAEDIKPRFKKLSPLDMQKVSVSFVDQEPSAVLQALAHAASLNLIIDSAARQRLSEGGTFTAEFTERPVRDVLDATCAAFNVAWKENKGSIFVNGRVRRIFSLDFLAQSKSADINIGGDVLGGQGGH